MQLGCIPVALFAEPARRYLAIGVRAFAFLVLAALTWYFVEKKPGLVLGALLFFLVLFAIFGGLGGVAYLPAIQGYPGAVLRRPQSARELRRSLFTAAFGVFPRGSPSPSSWPSWP